MCRSKIKKPRIYYRGLELKNTFKLFINTMQENDETYEQLFAFSRFFISHVVYYMHERKSYTLSHICVQYQLPCGMVCKIPSQSPGY